MLDGGKLEKEMNFQIGSSSSEKMEVNLSAEMGKVKDSVGTSASGVGKISLSASGSTPVDYSKHIETIETALENVGTVRSSLGANINRLGHTAANLANMKDNTELALGNIQDADFASEASSMTHNQMLAQTSMSGMVMSLLG